MQFTEDSVAKWGEVQDALSGMKCVAMQMRTHVDSFVSLELKAIMFPWYNFLVKMFLNRNRWHPILWSLNKGTNIFMQLVNVCVPSLHSRTSYDSELWKFVQ